MEFIFIFALVWAIGTGAQILASEKRKSVCTCEEEREKEENDTDKLRRADREGVR